MPDDDITTMMADDSPTTTDRLDTIRVHVKTRRDLARERGELEARLTRIYREAERLEMEVLPDLFSAAGVDRVDVAAEGNEPAFSATLQPYYKANIAASWPEPERAAAFDKLAEIGLGDIVKNVVTASFGPSETAEFERVVRLLDDNQVAYSIVRSVAWTTLTAAVREIYDRGGRLGADALAAIGARVGRIVKLK